MIAWVCALFTTPVSLTGFARLLLLLPLCLSISIVYKTIRCADLRAKPLACAVGALWVTVVVGMYAVGVGFWLLYVLLS